MPPDVQTPLAPHQVDTGKYLERDGTTYVVTDTFQGSTGTLLLLSAVDENGVVLGDTQVIPQAHAATLFGEGEVDLQQPNENAERDAQEARIQALEQQLSALRDPAPGSGSEAQVAGGRQTAYDPQPSAPREENAPENPTTEPPAGQRFMTSSPDQPGPLPRSTHPDQGD